MTTDYLRLATAATRSLMSADPTAQATTHPEISSVVKLWKQKKWKLNVLTWTMHSSKQCTKRMVTHWMRSCDLKPTFVSVGFQIHPWTSCNGRWLQQQPDAMVNDSPNNALGLLSCRMLMKGTLKGKHQWTKSSEEGSTWMSPGTSTNFSNKMPSRKIDVVKKCIFQKGKRALFSVMKHLKSFCCERSSMMLSGAFPSSEDLDWRKEKDEVSFCEGDCSFFQKKSGIQNRQVDVSPWFGIWSFQQTSLNFLCKPDALFVMIVTSSKLELSQRCSQRKSTKLCHEMLVADADGLQPTLRVIHQWLCKQTEWLTLLLAE